MPNKSDSAGKLHQYYTYQECKKIFPNATGSSPLDCNIEKNSHEILFTLAERQSLRKIGQLSCNIIVEFIGVNVGIVNIDDIGVSSGAGNINVTDDIVITTSEEKIIGFSLKCAKKIDKVLSKNMGAQSLLSSYFDSQELQNHFNDYYTEAYLTFLNTCLDDQAPTIAEAKKLIKKKSKVAGNTKPRFTDTIFPNANLARDTFLLAIRDKLSEAIKAMGVSNVIKACNIILDVETIHLKANYTLGREDVVLDVIPKQYEGNFKQYKSIGNNSLEIELTNYKVGFRYKFESDICSSIKLVGSYQAI